MVDCGPFHVQVAYRGSEMEIPDVLVDTGSATTILAAREVARIGIVPESSDMLCVIRGVGGVETVFTRPVEYLSVGQRRVPGFEIEVGGMDYGFEINSISGMDFSLRAGAILDLRELSLEFLDQASR
jgi:hypothetical protein